ncbi:hypothetical protein ACTJJ0_30885 [Chitinophaga sp. 22321]|uniref:Septum formation initiator n=1 Tax=Chitinophaga hostae TaxID=2831022 RepID=A0ABS5J8Q4_9BACT|nr:hypothetical protein [Chitinophaga hostae]MBS0031597.1 hypothetical protein [Chitinophaga hostae]
MSIKRSIYDTLDKSLKRDFVVGSFIGCIMAIVGLFSWGIHNEVQVIECNERFAAFALDLQHKTQLKLDEKNKEIDSLRLQAALELKKVTEIRKKIENQIKYKTK